MLKVTNFLAEQVFVVPIEGETKSYQIVPHFSSTLRRELYFWKNLPSTSEGESQHLFGASSYNDYDITLLRPTYQN